MLTIRLQRTGKKNRPDFRIILAEKTAAAGKKFVEILGSYNPRTKQFVTKVDRVKYWLSKHVEVSPTVHNLFVKNSLVDKPKVKAFSVPKKVVEEVKVETPKQTETETMPVSESEAMVENTDTESTKPEVSTEA